MGGSVVFVLDFADKSGYMSGDVWLHVWYLCRRASTSCRLGSAASTVARARASSQQQASLGFILTSGSPVTIAISWRALEIYQCDEW